MKSDEILYKLRQDNQSICTALPWRTQIDFVLTVFDSPFTLSQRFIVEWAKETRIEASMTSQIFKFEWFLNRKFKKYFLNGEGQISIKNGEKLGVAIYHQSADIADADNLVIYHESEGIKSEALYYANEKTDESSVSFTVFTPQIDETLITREAYLAMMSYYIDKYRLAWKTYNIKFNA